MTVRFRHSFLSSPVLLVLAANLLGAALLQAPASAQSAPTRPNRITAAIDETRLVALPGNRHPFATARDDRGPAPADTGTGRIALVLKRSATQDQALKEYLADLQNPSSPRFHKWLSPTQYGQSFGISDPDLETVENWLKSHGFRIEKVPAGRNEIQFSGTFGQLQSAFRVPMHSYLVDGEQHYANAADPQIPVALAPVIAGVASLNNFLPKSQIQGGVRAHFDSGTKTIKPDLTLYDEFGRPYLFMDPADAATVYDTPNATLNASYSGTTYDGTGVKIGVVGDSNISLQGIQNYRTTFLNETAATANVPTVIVDGNDPGINGDELEALLDNEVAGGLAPKAKLYLYTSDNTDLQSGLINAIFRALDDNTVSILNISFGGCEAVAGKATNALVLEGEEQAAAQGISVVVAAGDSGSAGCDSDQNEQATQGLAVNAFASTPYAIAVGGTDFDSLRANFTQYVTDANSGSPPYYRTALSYIPEQPWNNSTEQSDSIADNQPIVANGQTDIIAGGGGLSSVYTKPPFQTLLTPKDGARDLPDVSLLAGSGLYGAIWLVCGDTDCQTTNDQFTQNTTFTGVGGTSASAPAFAGMLALVEQKTGSRLGQANYVLYQLANSQYAAVFHDITAGDNSVVCASGSQDCGGNGFLTGYDAVTGYDTASGLGSVDAAQMVSAWSSVALAATSTNFNINGSTAPVTVKHGTPLTFNVRVNPATASGVAALIDTADEVSGGPANNSQLPIPLTAGAGSVTYNGLPGGSYTVYASYGGDTANAASTSSPAIPVTISAENSTTALQVNAYDGATGISISSIKAVPYGDYIYADAIIYGAAEGLNGTQGIATGSVKFTDGTSTLARAVAVNAGSFAAYTTPSNAFPTVFPVGAHSVTAAYSGDPSYSASTSATIPFTVVRAPTITDPVVLTDPITSLASTVILVAIRTSSLGVGPTGTITISANGKTLATLGNLGELNDANGTVFATGTGTILGNSLVGGQNTLTVSYSGDSNYLPSTATTPVTVNEVDFNLSNSGPFTVSAGATSGNTAAIDLMPQNGFVGLVNLSCAITSAPAQAATPPTCSIPASTSITSSIRVQLTLTIGSTASTNSGAYVVTVTGTDAATGKLKSTTAVDVTLTGGAAPPQPGFSLTSSGPVSVIPGAASGNTSTISVTPGGGFTGAVNLTCSITGASSSAATLPTCSVPPSVSVTGTSSVPATLTINTAAATTARTEERLLLSRGAATALALIVIFGIPKRRRLWMKYLSLAIALISIAGIGCGGSARKSGGSGPGPTGGTTAGAYTATVSATDAATGKITASTTVSVTVQ
jgi:trimeric autotransporter adhesin